ncbi:MAG: hypothetical protein COZ16_00645 [Flavobacteriaceae bacterium CG_4_10_14_3_um_filter_31_253]|nr:MAG: hypothetical protein AUK46_08500 [Flavobacteriaceae bacterium CG2_30_31_66]PIV95967.1 MAG: hypothetical protein COW43_10935 [Flavobacteriaceae bacterium CG17_big_fil_post_rev_8_21_14_2_50_31_13]PIX13577.1 MAG: hypothetical protein COZ74_05655 [Flavobacteriaceae bacterium CG_4_8_14_3_um_filter_31_8]PIY16302.1 MAG: hypothetical protein COZ16_00645 [Flavobacteriaceae bacterium CG_4_10_14_3_um_filter_31_253]PIZ11963.1 MAG: hypothetical protein COY55_02460 [Flavobacteriaceae bacterium CG_4_1
MKKIVLIFTLSLGFMSFTKSETSQNVDNSKKLQFDDVCTRTCYYAVNRETGSRRLLGCTDWDCGSLPEITLTVSGGN